MAKQEIRILSEMVQTVTPEPGVSYRQAAITYQVPPLPPTVAFIREDDLPDLVWRREHPDDKEVPTAVQAQGDKVRREKIAAQLQGRRGDRGRALP